MVAIHTRFGLFFMATQYTCTFYDLQHPFAHDRNNTRWAAADRLESDGLRGRLGANLPGRAPTLPMGLEMITLTGGIQRPDVIIAVARP